MTPFSESRFDDFLERLVRAPAGVTFSELRRFCDAVFGEGRQGGGSHRIYRTGLREPAIVNIQPQGKMAKPYQCRQVARAVRALWEKKGE